MPGPLPRAAVARPTKCAPCEPLTLVGQMVQGPPMRAVALDAKACRVAINPKPIDCRHAYATYAAFETTSQGVSRCAIGRGPQLATTAHARGEAMCFFQPHLHLPAQRAHLARCATKRLGALPGAARASPSDCARLAQIARPPARFALERSQQDCPRSSQPHASALPPALQ